MVILTFQCIVFGSMCNLVNNLDMVNFKFLVVKLVNELVNLAYLQHVLFIGW